MAGLSHLSFGFAAKRLTPKVPLGILLLSSWSLDALFFVFWIIGIETMEDGFWSHSLFMSVIWSVIAALVALLISRNLRTTIVIGLLVFSHWVMDFITWPMGAIYPNSTGIPLFFEGSPEVGLGLYNSLIAVIIVESALIITGVMLYIFTLKKLRTQKNEQIETK